MSNNLTILYVEDDEVVRDNFNQILQHYFNTVVVADNGLTALQYYQELGPDLVILDISIPLLSGLDVAAKIRADNADIPIIMLTAFSDQEKLLKAVNLQLFAYLIKPVSQPELDKTLRRVKKKLLSQNIIHLRGGYSWHDDEQLLYYTKNNNNDEASQKKASEVSIKLTHNENKIMSLLCNNPNNYYTAYDIVEKLSGSEDLLTEDKLGYNAVVQIISRLRKKLINNSKHFFIENTYGSGYRVIGKTEF